MFLQQERVLFSSFALRNILLMQKMLPNCQYGFLFTEELHDTPIYRQFLNNKHYQYLSWNLDNIHYVKDQMQAGLHYLHPEVTTIDSNDCSVIKDLKLGINIWSLFEELSSARLNKYKQLEVAALDHDLHLGVITDYLELMHHTFKSGYAEPQHKHPQY